jgi:hypothetical protein
VLSINFYNFSFEKTAGEMIQLGTTLLEAKSGYGNYFTSIDL